MKLKLLISIFFFGSLGSKTVAQLTVAFPTSRAVFQRDNSNQSTLYIGGSFDDCLDQVEARVTPRASGEGTATSWTVIQTHPAGGQFYGSMTVMGGWYQLDVRGIRNGSQVVLSSVDRVGVGEVFLVAGQSNATGGDGLPNGPSATDDRVSSVNFQNLNPNNNTIPPYSDVQLPCPEFVHLDDFVKTAPFGNYAWCWGVFGDSLAKRLNVPVLIFNSGWSGSAAFNWQESIDVNAVSTSYVGYLYPKGMPFGHLRLALNNYIAQQGYRAILWHLGEADSFEERSRENHRNELRTIINASRSLSGKPDLAWVIARASRMTKDGVSRIWQPIVDAQNDVIGANGNDPSLVLPNVFPGPETDPLQGPGLRTSDNIHFTGNGLVILAQAWNASLGSAFFANSTPYPPTPPPAVTTQCGPGTNQLKFQGPGGWATYHWLPENDCNQILNSNQDWTASTGKYFLKVTDNFQNVVLSPKLNVPVSTASHVVASGSATVSQGSDLTALASSTNACTFNWNGPDGFMSTQQNFVLNNVGPAQSGTYTVAATNAYGCQAQSSINVQVVSTIESIASGNWNDVMTWSCGCLPTAATDVKINAGHTIILNTTVHARNLLYQSGFLRFLNGGSLLLSQ